MKRTATIEDFDAIFKIFMDPSVNPYMSFEIISKTEFKPIFEDLIKSPSSLIIYEQNNEVAGACAVVRKQRRQTHIAYLGSLAFDPKYHGKGLAKEFMQSLILELRDEGFKRIELIVEADNPKAINFYEKLGFVKEGCMRNFLKRQNEDHFVDDYYMALLFD